MKVLWLTAIPLAAVKERLKESPAVAGPGSWIEGLVRALCDRPDFELAIASPEIRHFPPFKQDGVTYLNIPETQKRSRTGRIIEKWRQSRACSNVVTAAFKAVKYFNPDLIHVHGTENVFGLIAGETKIPVVVSLQGLLTACQRSYFHGFTSRDIIMSSLTTEFLKGRSEIHGFWRLRQKAERELQILKLNNVFLGRTEWDKAVLSAINPDAKYFDCAEIMRPCFYTRAWDAESASPKVIFCTSSAMIFKGAECLLEAVAILQRSGMSDLQLRIAGVPENSEVSRFYKKRAQQYGVDNGTVTWLGRVNAEDLHNELLKARVFAYPSHVDNSPNALCEAMLVGVPSIASYVGGIPSLLSDRREGLLYPDGDPYALAGKIRLLMSNTDLARKLSKSARQTALDRHDPDKVAKRMLEIYREALT